MASNEAQIVMAMHAYQQNQFRSLRATALAFNVPAKTLARRIKGTPSRIDSTPPNRKLTSTEETTLVEWILDMDTRGMPPNQVYIRQMAELVLKERVDGASSILGKHWVGNFIS